MENKKNKEMEKAIVVRTKPDDPETGQYMYTRKNLDGLLNHIEHFFTTSNLGDRLVFQSGEIEKFRHPKGWDASKWDGTVERLSDKGVQLNILFDNVDQKEKGFSFAYHGPNIHDTLNPLWTDDQIVAWRIGYADGLRAKEEYRPLIPKDKYSQSILEYMRSCDRYTMVSVRFLYDHAILKKGYRKTYEDFLDNLLLLVNSRAVALIHIEEDEFGRADFDMCFVAIDDSCLA